MLVAGYSLVACPCTLLLFGLSQRGQEYCCKVRSFDQMPTIFVGWNVEQGKRFAFFRQIKKTNQLNAVCRGCGGLNWPCMLPLDSPVRVAVRRPGSRDSGLM